MPRLVNLSDGRREIECAKQRLSAAKSNDASTSQNLTHAKLLAAQSKATLVSAQSMYVDATAAATAANKVMEKAKKSMDISTKNVESMHELSTKSKKEVEDAQKFLAEVEKRHEVIEITDDDDTVPSSEEGAGGKKRKVSLSPQISSTSGNVARDTSNNNNNNNSSTRVVEKLVVEGCGLSAVNGTYNRLYNNGFPVYEKSVNWNGMLTNFLIVARTNQFGNQMWAIGTTMGTSSIYFYSTCQAVNDVAPSENLIWMPEFPYGIAPSPRVKWG